MTRPAASFRGDFSMSDLLRAAAENAIGIEPAPEPMARVNSPQMTGVMTADEVQPGLLMSGYDLTYLEDGGMEVAIDRSLTCGLLLEGEVQTLSVDGYPSVRHQQGKATIIAFGEPRACRRQWRIGQRTRAFGFNLRPPFFERFGGTIEDNGLRQLQRLFDPGFHVTSLPRSDRLVDLAQETIDHPYRGELRSLYQESQTLRFVLEVARQLDERERLSQDIGRRRYEKLMSAREILDRSITNPPKTLDLAKQVGTNVTALQRGFRAAFGTTIFGYVRMRRLEMSRILLADYELGVAEAGFRVGFSSAAAFTAAYRRHFGSPPTADIARTRR